MRSSSLLTTLCHPRVRWSIFALVLLCCVAVYLASLIVDDLAETRSVFLSRPDISPFKVSVDQIDPELLSAGYFFLSPYQSDRGIPHIYDNDGNLIWSGQDSAGPGLSHDFHVCDYHGEPHLCFFSGDRMVGWGYGHGIIMDKHYRVMKSIQSTNFQAASDLHDFRLTAGGKSALLTQYLRCPRDLCAYGLCHGLGYVIDGAFQDVDVETGKPLFEWRSLDHINLTESQAPPGSTDISSTGQDRDHAWDYFHINSVEKNPAGDYLISARHTSTIYKISGKDGHIIWRLSGMTETNSDFSLADFQFSFQHDARFISETATETILSLFDNGSNGYTSTSSTSRGLVIRLDHTTATATVLHTFPGTARAKSQGNFQLLSSNRNANAVIGWGNNPTFSELLADGTPILSASYATHHPLNPLAKIWIIQSYRVYKSNWTGIPLTRPALWSYAKTDGSPTQIYVSWNGATQVSSWTIHTGPSADGPWALITGFEKDGFETTSQLQEYAPWVRATATDAMGKVLGESEVQETFVPPERMKGYCDDAGCQDEATQRMQAAGANTAFALAFVAAAMLFFDRRAVGKRLSGLRAWKNRRRMRGARSYAV